MITSKKTACVVVPVYTTALSPTEWLSLDRCIAVLGAHPIIVVKPHDLEISSLLKKYPALLTENFDAKYFADVKGYNRMMLADEFYARFDAYEFMLICQLDVFVFSDQLLKWCQRGYDYVGAPWIPSDAVPSRFHLLTAAIRRKYYRLTNRQYKHQPGDHHAQQHYSVGNGGFSLRRIDSMRRALARLNQRAEPYRQGHRTPWAEDIFFSIEANRYRCNVSRPGFKEATNFAWETFPKVAAKFCDAALPFGFHAWQKLARNEWQAILALGDIKSGD